MATKASRNSREEKIVQNFGGDYNFFRTSETKRAFAYNASNKVLECVARKVLTFVTIDKSKRLHALSEQTKNKE